MIIAQLPNYGPQQTTPSAPSPEQSPLAQPPVTPGSPSPTAPSPQPLTPQQPSTVAPQPVNNIINTLLGTGQTVIGLLFLIATIIFLWGIIQFILSAGNPEGRAKARGIMLWGIIGLAVMAAGWGIARLLLSSFGIPTSPPVFVPPPQP